MRLAVLIALAAAVGSAADPNTLTAEEKRQGYRLLFDGKTFANWKDPAKKDVPNEAWTVEDGTLKTVTKGNKFSEDLISDKPYGDFELKFDWKMNKAGNTGLKYRIQKEIFLEEEKVAAPRFEQMMGRELLEHKSNRKTYTGGRAQLYTVGFEFQLLDDENHPDGRKDATHRTGALYSFIAPKKTAAKPVGEWNSARLVVRGDHFEHWLNGVVVLEGSLKDKAVEQGAGKRWSPAPAIKEMLVNAKPTGTVALQHHGDEVWFRAIKIHELPSK